MSTSAGDAAMILGPMVREHRTRWTYVLGVAGGAALFAALGVLGAYLVIVSLVRDSPGDGVIVGLVAMVAFLLGAALMGLRALRRVKQVVALHQNGVHYRDGRGEHVVPWEAIDGVFQKIVRVYRAGEEVDVRDEYTLLLRDGRRITVDYHLEEIDAFGSALNEALLHLVLPSYRQAFQAGRPLDFGVVRLDGSGVHTASGSLPWREVQGISWKAGILASDRAFLQIRRIGGLLAWAKLPIEEVKNYPVLMAIAADVGKAE